MLPAASRLGADAFSELNRLEFGGAFTKCGVLVKLKMSTRKSIFTRSVNLKFLTTETSVLPKPGARRTLRPSEPKRNGLALLGAAINAGSKSTGRKAVGSNQEVPGPMPLIYLISPIKSGV